jgi:hypothetical protein
MAIENRPAKGCALDRIPIAAARDVAAAQDELEFAYARFTEEGDRARAKSGLAGVRSNVM